MHVAYELEERFGGADELVVVGDAVTTPWEDGGASDLGSVFPNSAGTRTSQEGPLTSLGVTQKTRKLSHKCQSDWQVVRTIDLRVK